MSNLFQVTNFEVRTVKHATGNPSYKWVNTYECHIGTAQAGLEAWSTFATYLASIEMSFHTPNVEIERVVISTIGAESPYDPDQLFVQEVSYTGSKTITTDPLPRHACLFVKRQAGYGRAGKIFYRGALSEAELQSTSALDLRMSAAGITAYQSLLTSFFQDLSSALADLGGAGSYLALFGPVTGGVPASTREVTSLVVRGISVNKPDHKYFDRAEA